MKQTWDSTRKKYVEVQPTACRSARGKVTAESVTPKDQKKARDEVCEHAAYVAYMAYMARTEVEAILEKQKLEARQARTIRQANVT